jgi:hypothetical protein
LTVSSLNVMRRATDFMGIPVAYRRSASASCGARRGRQRVRLADDLHLGRHPAAERVRAGLTRAVRRPELVVRDGQSG